MYPPELYSPKPTDEVSVRQPCAEKWREENHQESERCGFRREHIERFRQLYHEQFGDWLSEVEAERQLKSLVAVVRYQQQNRLLSNQLETP